MGEIKVIHETKSGNSFAFALYKTKAGLSKLLEKGTVHTVLGEELTCKPTLLRDQLKKLQMEEAKQRRAEKAKERRKKNKQKNKKRSNFRGGNEFDGNYNLAGFMQNLEPGFFLQNSHDSMRVNNPSQQYMYMANPSPGVSQMASQVPSNTTPNYFNVSQNSSGFYGNMQASHMTPPNASMVPPDQNVMGPHQMPQQIYPTHQQMYPGAPPRLYNAAAPQQPQMMYPHHQAGYNGQGYQQQQYNPYYNYNNYYPQQRPMYAPTNPHMLNGIAPQQGMQINSQPTPQTAYYPHYPVAPSEAGQPRMMFPGPLHNSHPQFTGGGQVASSDNKTISSGKSGTQGTGSIGGGSGSGGTGGGGPSSGNNDQSGPDGSSSSQGQQGKKAPENSAVGTGSLGNDGQQTNSEPTNNSKNSLNLGSNDNIVVEKNASEGTEKLPNNQNVSLQENNIIINDDQDKKQEKINLEDLQLPTESKQLPAQKIQTPTSNPRLEKVHSEAPKRASDNIPDPNQGIIILPEMHQGAMTTFTSDNTSYIGNHSVYSREALPGFDMTRKMVLETQSQKTSIMQNSIAQDTLSIKSEYVRRKQFEQSCEIEQERVKKILDEDFQDEIASTRALHNHAPSGATGMSGPADPSLQDSHEEWTMLSGSQVSGVGTGLNYKNRGDEEKQQILKERPLTQLRKTNEKSSPRKAAKKISKIDEFISGFKVIDEADEFVSFEDKKSSRKVSSKESKKAPLNKRKQSGSKESKESKKSSSTWRLWTRSVNFRSKNKNKNKKKK